MTILPHKEHVDYKALQGGPSIINARNDFKHQLRQRNQIKYLDM